MGRTFDELVAEAEAAPTEGWDFSWLEGRATEERPSWGHQRTMGERLAGASAALDIQTGGGEVLAGIRRRAPLTVATEGWPPNVARATRLLHPLGVAVVADTDEPPLPFADGPPRPAPCDARADRAGGAVRGAHDPVPHRGPHTGVRRPVRRPQKKSTT
ncbi:hypothetical protein HNR10_004628 [Nocardiopsis aegyptia]|uniref:Uncharacterized protein n=1 Tax=Nocardiopsis aegyptia TaxID=220378 RepID=A0A7Z0ERV2_9ACTN|nr:hypothetical protein [Nocardiopsis aegyptia]